MTTIVGLAKGLCFDLDRDEVCGSVRTQRVHPRRGLSAEDEYCIQ